MESELFWTFYDDMLAGWVPSDHVVVFWAFEETVEIFQHVFEGKYKGDIRI